MLSSSDLLNRGGVPDGHREAVAVDAREPLSVVPSCAHGAPLRGVCVQPPLPSPASSATHNMAAEYDRRLPLRCATLKMAAPYSQSPPLPVLP